MKSILVLLAIIAGADAGAAALDGISASTRSRIEQVSLDSSVQQQVNSIDAMTLAGLPAEYRNERYLLPQAKAMYEKARESYQHGINLYSIGADSSHGPLPSQGQSGQLFQAAKLYLHAGDKYARLVSGGGPTGGDTGVPSAGSGLQESEAGPPGSPQIPDYPDVPADQLDSFTGLGKRTYNNGFYVGSIVQGKRNGIGIAVLKDGEILAGTWVDNEFSGLGAVFSPDGDRYKGSFLGGTRNGRGTYWYRDGSRYEGEWRDGEKNGHGTMIWPNGDRYEGDWRDGNREGRGTLIWKNGDRYEGDWHDNKREGRGALTWKNGKNDRYDGEWHNDKREGRGTLIWKDGTRFEGEWRNDNRNGNGTLTTANGDRLVGTWVDDRGKGMVYRANGKVEPGSNP